MTKNPLAAVDDDADPEVEAEPDEIEETDDADPGNAPDDADDDLEDPEAEFLAGLSEPQVAFYRAQQAKLEKANRNARTHRLARQALEKGQPIGGGPKPTPLPRKPGAPAHVDAEAIIAQVRAEFEQREKTNTITAAARQGLVAAGLSLPADKSKHAAVLSRAVKLLGDLSALETDDVEAEVAELRREMPSLFTSRRKRPAGGGVGGPRNSDSGNGRKKDPIAGLFDG